ncbi:MAG: cupin domain-containing protein [Nevskia sp.]|nr:cupin domain-containing protein [Nevskia sp.]
MAAEAGIARPTFKPQARDEPRLRRAACCRHGIDWTSFDRLLHALEPRFEQLQLRLRGEAIDPARYVDSADGRLRLIKERVYTLMREGARLLLPQVEHGLLEARQLAAVVGRRHGLPTRASACLTFSDKAGSEALWLTEDCEIVQLLGRQRLLIYGLGIDDPLPGQDSAVLSPVCPTEALFDVTLDAGDVLELPRGWWHRYVALDVPSAQLTVQIEQPTLHDYISWALARHAPGRTALRRRLVDDPARSAADLGAAVDALRELLLDPSLLADYRRVRAVAERPQPEFELAWLAGQQQISDDTPLRLSTAQAPVRTADSLLVNGCALAADSPAANLLRELAQAPSLSIGQLAARQPSMSAEALHDALLDLSAHGLLVIGGVAVESAAGTG